MRDTSGIPVERVRWLRTHDAMTVAAATGHPGVLRRAEMSSGPDGSCGLASVRRHGSTIRSSGSVIERRPAHERRTGSDLTVLAVLEGYEVGQTEFARSVEAAFCLHRSLGVG